MLNVVSRIPFQLSFLTCLHCFLSTLLFSDTRCWRPILYFPYPSTGIRHFSKEPKFLLGVAFSNLDLTLGVLNYIEVSLLLVFSAYRARKICYERQVYTNTCNSSPTPQNSSLFFHILYSLTPFFHSENPDSQQHQCFYISYYTQSIIRIAILIWPWKINLLSRVQDLVIVIFFFRVMAYN